MIVWTETPHFCIQTEIHLIAVPQLIATLNNYTCSLPPLANFDWSASPECFFLTMQIHNWWNGTNGGLQFGSGNLIWLPLAAHACLVLVVEYWPFVGVCGCHSYSKLYHCVILLLFLAFAITHSTPVPFLPTLLYILAQY